MVNTKTILEYGLITVDLSDTCPKYQRGDGRDIHRVTVQLIMCCGKVSEEDIIAYVSHFC